MADARGRSYRKSHAKGTDDVVAWISKWWGDDVSDLRVRSLKIAVPSSAMIEALEHDEIFKAALRNSRESDLHGLLKYASWLWLENQESMAAPNQSNLLRFEQRVFFPLEIEPLLSPKYHPLGGEFDQTMAQVIRRGDENVRADNGFVCAVDVYGKGTNIEVGSTYPFNLLKPLTEMLSNRAVWVPYPKNLPPRQFDIRHYGFRSVLAYEIAFVDIE